MQQSLLEEQQLDTTIQNIAETYGLGLPTLVSGTKSLAWYRKNRRQGLYMILFGILLIIAFVVYLFITIVARGEGPAFNIIGTVVLLLSVSLLFLGSGQFSQRQLLFYTCPQGLLCYDVRRKLPKIVRWDEVESVEFISDEEISRYTLKRSNGTKFVFAGYELGSTNAFQQVAKAVEYAIIRLRLPQALNAYGAGQLIPFGKITVSQRGLQYKQREYSWQEIKRISKENSPLMSTLTAPLFNTKNELLIYMRAAPNYCVLIALIDTLTHDSPSL